MFWGAARQALFASQVKLGNIIFQSSNIGPIYNNGTSIYISSGQTNGRINGYANPQASNSYTSSLDRGFTAAIYKNNQWYFSENTGTSGPTESLMWIADNNGTVSSVAHTISSFSPLFEAFMTINNVSPDGHIGWIGDQSTTNPVYTCWGVSSSLSTISWQKKVPWSVYEVKLITCDASNNWFVLITQTTFGVTLIKFNSSGVEQWQRNINDTSYGGNFSQSTCAVDANGDIVILSSSNIAGYAQPVLLKYDTNGNLKWQKTVGLYDTNTIGQSDTLSINGTDIFVTTENYDISLISSNSFYSISVLRFDQNGTLLQSQDIGFNNNQLMYDFVMSGPVFAVAHNVDYMTFETTAYTSSHTTGNVFYTYFNLPANIILSNTYTIGSNTISISDSYSNVNVAISTYANTVGSVSYTTGNISVANLSTTTINSQKVAGPTITAKVNING